MINENAMYLEIESNQMLVIRNVENEWKLYMIVVWLL